MTYHWPGNIRELQNCIERAVALTEFDQITPRDLPASLGESSPVPLPADENLPDLPTVEEVTLGYARDVLRLLNGNRSLTARVLGMDRRTLQRMLADAREDAASPELEEDD
jgi:DNA-binding NtrC family response regulator